MDVVCVVGPTAVGKTRLGIQLAKRFDGEVISGDSMQVYKGMDIGTAKAAPGEMEGIPHHLLSEKNPDETYSVAEFQKSVRTKMEEIKNRGKLPIIVGGTGLYIKAVLYDYEFTDEPATPRGQMEEKYAALTNEELHRRLVKVDLESAAQIHPNNRKRLLRALEIYETSGEKKSERNDRQEHKLLYDAIIVGLEDDREALYERINSRVDDMMEKGLLGEVRALFDAGILETSQAIRAIGYKELYSYFRQESQLEDVIEKIKKNSRNYAKRQFTWFRNQMEVAWFKADVSDFEKTIEQVGKYIEQKKHRKGADAAQRLFGATGD